jgi:ribokinase
MNTVAVFGSINMDITAFVDRSPAPGETVLGDSLIRNGGGKGANQAVGAARAGGANTLMVGALGKDPDGDILARSMNESGVDTEHIDRVDGPSGTALITVASSGENSIVVIPGANAQVDAPVGRALEAIRGADVLLAQLEVPPGAVASAAEARAEGATFILNAAPAIPIPQNLWDQVDILVVNEHEALIMADAPDATMDQALAALLERVPAVLVTLGGAGSELHTRSGETIAVPAVMVDAVDTTAAGDTYCGVLAAELAHGNTPLVAMQRASSAAALAVQAKGAQDSVPQRGDTLAFWATHFDGK